MNIFELSATEKATFRKNGIRLKTVGEYSVAELCGILDTTLTRGKQIYALFEFQTVPSVGVRFAEDLIAMGYYSLDQLKHKSGSDLISELEHLKGYWQDPCVEDQCRLVIHFANNKDTTKRWWHFTEERKALRVKNGYPPDRPIKAWFETLGYVKER